MNYLAEAQQTKSDQFHGDKIALGFLTGSLAEAIEALQRLDRIKKALFYGKEAASLPLVGIAIDCRGLPAMLIGHDAATAIDVLHGIIGKATEAGEMLEALAACIDQGQSLDAVNLLEEIGDGQWYDAILCGALGATFEQVQRTNIQKLRHRFPQKFTEYDANNRDLLGERVILEETTTQRVGMLEHSETHRIYAGHPSIGSMVKGHIEHWRAGLKLQLANVYDKLSGEEYIAAKTFLEHELKALDEIEKAVKDA